MTNVTIPNSVTRIGESAFSGCRSLTSVTIPNSVTSIRDDAFYLCDRLTSVTIPDSVTTIGSGAFQYCNSMTNGTIPNSVTYIGDEAFSCCTSLTSVTIGSNVAYIGPLAFYYCTSVTNFSGGNSTYRSLDGVLFDDSQPGWTTLFQFPAGRGGSYIIPDNVFGNPVISIGDSAFDSCTSLTSVTVGNSVLFIGGFAFFACASLTNVTIGNGVTTIGYGAFYNCTDLTSVTFLGNAPSGGVDMFSNIAASAKVYYFYGTTGWGPTYGDLPTVMLGAPAPQVGAGSAGVKPGGFSFTLNGVVNQTIVVEASTNLMNWQPVWNRTLSTPSTNFVDPGWVNHPHRFYRLRSP